MRGFVRPPPPLPSRVGGLALCHSCSWPCSAKRRRRHRRWAGAVTAVAGRWRSRRRPGLITRIVASAGGGDRFLLGCELGDRVVGLGRATRADPLRAVLAWTVGGVGRRRRRRGWRRSGRPSSCGCALTPRARDLVELLAVLGVQDRTVELVSLMGGTPRAAVGTSTGRAGFGTLGQKSSGFWSIGRQPVTMPTRCCQRDENRCRARASNARVGPTGCRDRVRVRNVSGDHHPERKTYRLQ